MKVDTITELKVVSYTKLKNNDKRNLLNRAKRKTECVVIEVKIKDMPDFCKFCEAFGYNTKPKRVFVEVEEK